MSISKEKLEFGDYQTPLEFCEKVLNTVKECVNPTVILEPTFGIGNFIKAVQSRLNNVNTIYGVEINKEYCDKVKETGTNLTLFNEDIFSFDHKKIINNLSSNDRLLILGNPPWVTNSQLMSQDLKNLPRKNNFKKLKGLDSITGASNFDICEYIILDLLNKYKNQNAYIAMLCKTSVVINIMKEINKYDFNISDIRLYQFDAKKIFNVSCEACLFFAKIDKNGDNVVSVYDIDEAKEKLYDFGWKNDKFYSNFNMINSEVDGKFPFQWRQGIKHDCSKIMELQLTDDCKYINGEDEIIDVESTLIYPLLKSSDLKYTYINKTRKFVIVPQSKTNENTSYIASTSPKLWNYLNINKERFDSRKSSIYKNSPTFSIFGIGDYSFSKYKVAISGFYKEPSFSVLSPDDKTIMLDDTCYFIGFEDEKYAIITMALLNSSLVQDFLKSIAFLDKKRPYTKDILMRINLQEIINNTNFNDLQNLLCNYNLKDKIVEKDYDCYKNSFIYQEQLSII